MLSRITQSFPVGFTVAAFAMTHGIAAASTVEPTFFDSRPAVQCSADTQICIDAPAAVQCLAAAGTVVAFSGADSSVSSRVQQLTVDSTRWIDVIRTEEGETPDESIDSAVQEFRLAVVYRMQ